MTRPSIAVVVAGCLATSVALADRASGQTVINVPPDAAPDSISGNTILNLLEGGELPYRFTVADGAVANVLGGLAPLYLFANDGATVNISGGTVVGLQANEGSLVNITGGTVGPFGPTASSGSKVIVDGSAILNGFTAKAGSLSQILGGTMQLYVSIEAAAEVEVRGGTLAGAFNGSAGAAVTFFGDGFELDGTPIPGLENISDRITITVPYGSQFAGVFADATPFALSFLDGDGTYWTSFTLMRSPYTAGPPLIQLPRDPAPRGVHAGQTLEVGVGALVGDHFQAARDSVTRVVGGSIGNNFEAAGARVEISSGEIGRDFTAFAGSNVVVNGGRLGGNAQLLPDAVLDVNGGHIASLYANADAAVNIRGGTIAGWFALRRDADVHLFGEDFRLNGVPVAELDQIGDQRKLTATQFDRDFVLSGTLADGTPFAFSGTDNDNAYFEEGYTLHRVAVAPPEADTIRLPLDASPKGLRDGQSLFVEVGGQLAPDFNASHGSTLIVAGGSVGSNLETVQATVRILDGSIGDDFDAFAGTHVELRGGAIGRSFYARGGAKIDVFGGQIGAGFSLGAGTALNVYGGSLSSLGIGESSTASFWGGNFGNLSAAAGAEINLFGLVFLLNGVPIVELARPGDSLILPPTVGDTLQVQLADGDWVDLTFAIHSRVGPDFVHPGATLRLIVAVPEPSSLCLMSMGALPFVCRSRTRTALTLAEHRL